MSLLEELKIGILMVLYFEGFIFTKISVANSWKITEEMRLSNTLVLNSHFINEN